MKKYPFLPIVLCLCACTGNKTSNNDALADSANIELQETVVNHLDSLACILCDSTQLASIHSIFDAEALNLTDVQKMVKPDYLLENKDFEDLVTLSEKYRANAMAMVDSRVKLLYSLDSSSDYIAYVERLQADIADKAFEEMKAKGHEDFFVPDTYMQLYDEMKKAGRLQYFYESTTAMLVETLYILSKNDDVLVSKLSDEQTQALVRNLSAVTEATDLLAQSEPTLNKSAQQLRNLSSITASTTSELKDQLATVKNEIGALRILMLKDRD